MRILIVEDEPFMADALNTGLRRLGWAVDVAEDGQSATEKVTVNPYDVVLLDRDLPLMHGDDVCVFVAEHAPATRILMLTAAGSVDDRVEGLRLGADDYLPKPFAFAELVERIKALGRREPQRRPDVLEAQDLRLDASRRCAWRGGLLLNLTKKELATLEVLMRAQGAVVSAEELLDRVWDENIDPLTSVVRVTMSTLRRKLGQPNLIETVSGQGYRL